VARSQPRKLKLIAFRAVCSELCAERLKREGGWQFQSLSPWIGPHAFIEYEDLVVMHWMDKTMRHETVPAFLHALTVAPKPTVLKIRPEIREIIYEAKEALGK